MCESFYFSESKARVMVNISCKMPHEKTQLDPLSLSLFSVNKEKVSVALLVWFSALKIVSEEMLLKSVKGKALKETSEEKCCRTRLKPERRNSKTIGCHLLASHLTGRAETIALKR